MSTYDDLDFHATAGRGFLFWVILVTAAVVGMTFVHYWLQPTWLGYEHKAFVESHQYIEARKTELLTNIEKYDDLTVQIAKYEQSPDKYVNIITGLKAQQRSLARKIRAALTKIPKTEHPEGVERFEK